MLGGRLLSTYEMAPEYFSLCVTILLLAVSICVIVIAMSLDEKSMQEVGYDEKEWSLL